jgi:flagellar hook assembly protein FlgD
LNIGDLIEYGDYLVSVNVSDIIAQNYALNDGQITVKVSDSHVTFIASESCATPLAKSPKSAQKHGILLEKSVVSQVAKIEVKTPEPTQITLAIYDNLGNVMFETSGRSFDSFTWNLTNKAGRKVANGTYLIVAEAKGTSGKTYRYSVKLGVKR